MGSAVLRIPQLQLVPSVLRPVLGPAAGGLLCSIALTAAAGRATLPLGMELPVSFGGLLQPARSGGTAPAMIVLLALAGLVRCWWSLLRVVRSGRTGLRPVAWTAVAWTVPVLAAPPLLSLDAYAYLAQGDMVAAGVDAYLGGPILLGDASAGRTDPMWRGSAVPYGPLTLLLLRGASVLPGGFEVQVFALRAAVLLGVAAAVAGALHFAPAARRAEVLAVTAANPIVVVHLVGGVHIDGVLAAFVALTALAVAARHVWLGWALAAAAVAVKVTAAPLLCFAGLGLLRRMRWWTVAAAGGLLVLPFALTLLVVDRPWGFVAALAVPGAAAPWYAPASLLGSLLVGAVALLGMPADPAGLRLLARLIVLLVGTGAVLWLVRAQIRDGDRSDRMLERVGLALLVVPLSLPALYGWYLAAGLFLVAATGRHHRLLVLLSSALTFTSLPPLYDVSRWGVALAWAGALAILATGSGKRRRSRSFAPRRLQLTSDGHASRWSRTARRSGAALMAVLAAGLMVPSANADRQRPDRQDERVLERRTMVAYLDEAYPRLQVVAVAAPADSGVVRVTLVEPGRRICTLRLRSDRAGTGRYVRLPDVLSGRTPRALDEQSCPPPVG